MAGIINDQMGAAPQPGAQPPAAPGAPNPGTRLILLAVGRILHSPQTADQIIKYMQQAGDPVKAVAGVLMLIARQVMEKATPKGAVTGEMLASAAPQAVQEIIQLGIAAKVLQPDPQLAQKVMAVLQQQFLQWRQKRAQPAAPGVQPGAQPAAQPGL